MEPSEAQPTRDAQLPLTFNATIPTLKRASHSNQIDVESSNYKPFCIRTDSKQRALTLPHQCSTHNQRFNPNFWPTQFKARLTNKQAGKPDNPSQSHRYTDPRSIQGWQNLLYFPLPARSRGMSNVTAANDYVSMLVRNFVGMTY